MLDLRIGTVTSVDITTGMISITGDRAGQSNPIHLDNALSLQEMPDIGTVVLYIVLDKGKTQIVKMWQNRADLLRVGQTTLPNGQVIKQAPLLPGEVQVQSAGGGYFYSNASGDISITDGSWRNIFRMLAKKMQSILSSTEIILETFSGVTAKLKSDGSCEIKSVDATTSTTKASIIIDVDGNISATSVGNISVNGKNINLNTGTLGVARNTDTVSVTIPVGSVAVIVGGVAVPSVTPITLSGTITGGSTTVKAG